MLPIMSALRALRQSGVWPTAVKAVILSPTNELAAQQVSDPLGRSYPLVEQRSMINSAFTHP